MQDSLTLSYTSAYLVTAGMRLGNIIESFYPTKLENIFDIYEMAASEINFVKAMSNGEGQNLFAVKTLDGESLLFVRQSRDICAMAVLCLHIEQIKELLDSGFDINLSPTLSRFVRKCTSFEKTGIYDVLCNMNFYMDGSISDKECVYRGMIGCSSVYNCNIEVSERNEKIYSGVEAIMSREFFSLLTSCVCMASSKYGSGEVISCIEDRGNVIAVDITAYMSRCERVERLMSVLCELADMLCVSITYEIFDDRVRIYTCPYYVDDGLLGVKSRINIEV